MAGERDRAACAQEWFADLIPLPRSIEAGGGWATIRSLTPEEKCQAAAALESALGPWLGPGGEGRVRLNLVVDAEADRGWAELRSCAPRPTSS